MDDSVLLGVVGQNGVLLFLLLVDSLLSFSLLVLIFLRELVVLLLVLRLTDGSQSGFLSLQFAQHGLQGLRSVGFGVGKHTFHEFMVGIKHDGIHVRHLCIESHATLEAAHVLHTAHVFALRDDDRLCLFAQRLHLNGKLRLLHLRCLRLEHL